MNTTRFLPVAFCFLFVVFLIPSAVIKAQTVVYGTPEVQIETVVQGKVTGRYANIPVGSEIMLVDFYSGAFVSSERVRSVGNGTFSFSVSKRWNGGAGGLIYVKAFSSIYPYQMLTQSKQFQMWGGAARKPSCVLTSSAYRVAGGEPFKLSWKSTGAQFVFWEGKENSKKGSETKIETVPGVHQYVATAQGDTTQALCFAFVTVLTPEEAALLPETQKGGGTTKPKGSFSDSALTVYNDYSAISGVATGVNSVALTIGKNGKNYKSPNIPIVNGIWTHTVPIVLINGAYPLTLYGESTVTGKRMQLKRAKLAVNVYRPEQEAAQSPVVVNLNGTSYDAGETVTVRLRGSTKSLPQPLVLAASRSVDWIIENPDNVPITKIIVIEYAGKQKVQAPADVLVQHVRYNPNNDDGYAASKGMRFDDLIDVLHRKFDYFRSGVEYNDEPIDFIELYVGVKG